MEARLPCTILGVLVVLWAQVAAAMVELDRQKIGGFWREVGVASYQSLVLMAPKRVEGLFLTLNGSNLTVKVAYNSSGSCEIEKIVGSEIDTMGKFAFPGHREIHVLDTDYEGYAILRVSLMWRGRSFHVLKYFSKLGLGGLCPAAACPGTAHPAPLCPTARSLEDEDRLGFWRFRELTADTGLYLAARPGEPRVLGVEAGLGPVGWLCSASRWPYHAGRCAELLKEVSLTPDPGLH
ncbi:epididymal-specific lipocalin-8 isoform X1 [Theropithecus gelada]|uniref:epididymal-specific lipocalin-8 isoform X1 n=1 Tax=Theropithecus gelada TaxID=9565 RepID=UPI000DC172CA|nr:epididymal-specific lipocalin-8 isoform X1 [Theropithecus gelada]